MQPDELAAELIRYDTTSPVTDAAVFEFIQDFLADHGITAELHEHNGTYSLTAEIGTGSPRICLNGHVDVVPAGNNWSVTDPFEPVVQDGKLYGRGATDMKGGLAAQILAFCDLAEQDDLPGSVTLMISGDEEIGSHNGSEPLIETLDRFDQAIIAEPTDCNIQIGARGLLWATVTVHGETAHASRPHLVDNIMETVPAVMERLNALDMRNSTDPLLPDATAEVTVLNTDGPYNSIPDNVEIGLDIRYTANQSPGTIAADIRSCLTGLDADWSVTWEDHGRAYRLEDERFKEIATDAVTDVLGQAPKHITEGGISDGKYFARTDTPYLELGPIQATGHQPDEYCHIEDLRKLRAVYRQITEELLVAPDQHVTIQS